MSAQATFALPAPAKLNLGLEILGKRGDGYHELSTIFVAVSLFDTLEFAPSTATIVHSSNPELERKPNLVQKALLTARRLAPSKVGARITLHKRIPLAAGLGGASSDAATTFMGCQRLWNTDFGFEQLLKAAAELGSDVPFFLRGGCAFGQGRGELLKPLTITTETWFVLVSPNIVIQDKTATLFRDLTAADYSRGDRISQQVRSLERSGTLDTSLLVNAFTRPLFERLPALETIVDAMKDAGAAHIALTGAGPTHYSVEIDPERASRVADHLRGVLGNRARVEVVQAIPPRVPHENWRAPNDTSSSKK